MEQNYRRSLQRICVLGQLVCGTLAAQSLPSNWQSGAIGNTYAANSSTYSNGVFTLVGPGDGMGGGSDSFQFAYLPLSGDGTIVARWTGAQAITGYSRYGVMIREGTTATAAAAFMSIAGSNVNLEYRYRASTGANMGAASGAYILAPYW